MNDGYIKLWRCSLDSQVWNNEGLWQMWCWCLLKASYRDKWITVRTGKGETEVNIKPGQFIFGRKSAAKELKVNPETARKRLEKLKNIGNLTTQPGTHFTIVTICKWGAFQCDDPPERRGDYHASTNQVPTKYQPSTTNKKVKNIKKVKKETFMPDSYEVRLSNLLLSKILLRNPNHKKPNIQSWAKHIDYMIRLDNRDPQQIANVINWCQGDSFEQNNILSTEKLRKRFDALVLKMKPQTNTADNAREAKVAALLGGGKCT
jgi:hypothetical protein